ncbi:hypothetical protein N9F09_01125 [Schleiferiaceae bacterium]|nr:hypothetical protein [Schleiferiaceae bacterium]
MKTKGTIVYFHQDGFTLGSELLISHEEDPEKLQKLLENFLFVKLCRLLHKNRNFSYSLLDTNENLHIRLETISNNECIYDSSHCGILAENKVFAVGNTERSLISFAITHNELFTAFILGDEFEKDFMYRRYLHMGDKPNCFNDYIECEGSTMWHAINTKMLPQPLSKIMKSPMRIKRNPDLPF